MNAFWKILVILGVAVLFVLFVMSGKELFFKDPEHSDYFEKPPPAAEIKSQEECEQIGGKWNDFEGDRQPKQPVPKPVNGKNGDSAEVVEYTGWCDQGFEQREAYDKAHEEYERKVFISLVVIGLSAFIAGLIMAAIKATSPIAPSIGGGFSIGGIVITLIGTADYWGDMDEVFRFALTGMGLVLIIVVAIFIPRIMKRIQKN